MNVTTRAPVCITRTSKTKRNKSCVLRGESEVSISHTRWPIVPSGEVTIVSLIVSLVIPPGYGHVKDEEIVEKRDNLPFPEQRLEPLIYHLIWLNFLCAGVRISKDNEISVIPLERTEPPLSREG